MQFHGRPLGSMAALLVAALAAAGAAHAAPSAYKARCARYIEALASKPEGAYGAVVRLVNGAPIELDTIARDLEHLRSRRDCADFPLSGFVRLLYLADGARPAARGGARAARGDAAGV